MFLHISWEGIGYSLLDTIFTKMFSQQTVLEESIGVFFLEQGIGMFTNHYEKFRFPYH